MRRGSRFKPASPHAGPMKYGLIKEVPRSEQPGECPPVVPSGEFPVRPSLSPGQRGPASEKAIRPRVTSSCQTHLQPTARCGGGLWTRGREVDVLPSPVWKFFSPLPLASDFSGSTFHVGPVPRASDTRLLWNPVKWDFFVCCMLPHVTGLAF